MFAIGLTKFNQPIISPTPILYVRWTSSSKPRRRFANWAVRLTYRCTDEQQLIQPYDVKIKRHIKTRSCMNPYIDREYFDRMKRERRFERGTRDRRFTGWYDCREKHGYRWLEPDDGKLSSPVPRRGGGSNPFSLFDRTKNNTNFTQHGLILPICDVQKQTLCESY